MMKITKTEQVLLARYRTNGKTWVNGKREVDAAKSLISKGLATRFDNLGGMSKGEYYIHPFTRKGAISRSIYVYGGELYFAA